jgi:hypothetical protein
MALAVAVVAAARLRRRVVVGADVLGRLGRARLRGDVADRVVGEIKVRDAVALGVIEAIEAVVDERLAELAEYPEPLQVPV